MNWWKDLALAVRSLRRSPSYSAVAIVTLALGVAATTAMFSVVEGVLLRPLAFAAPEQLVNVASALPPKMMNGAVSYPDFLDWRRQSHAFAAMGGYSVWPGFSLTAGDRPERLPGVRLSPEALATLGVKPLLGRLLQPDEATAGRDRVVVLGEALWRRRFAADPGIVGRTVRINGETRTVVGVLPAWLHFPVEAAQPSAVYLPLVPSSAQLNSRGNHWMRVVARLAPGVAMAAAQAEMDGIARRLGHDFPDSDATRTISLAPLRSHLTAGVRQPIGILFGAVGLLLAIACVNVANLLLASGIARWRESAVRRALGATRWDLARRFVAEGVLLALASSVVALPLIWAGLRALLALAPADLPRVGEIGLDGRALFFSLAVSCFTGLVFSLAPTWQAGALEGSELIKAGTRSSAGAGSRRLRDGLVVAELALSLLLLVGSGLLLHSLWNLARVDPGFHSEGVVTADVALPEARYDHTQTGAFYHRLLSRLAALPGVKASGMISLLPERAWGWNSTLNIVGAPPLPDTADTWVETRSVSAGYFAAMGIPLLRGRLLRASDDAAAPPVVVLNEAAVRRFWPASQRLAGGSAGASAGADGEPLGVRVNIGGDVATVVGVVRDVHNAGLERAPLPESYSPYEQEGLVNMTLVLRSGSADPMSLVPALRRAVQQEDRDLPLDHVTALTEVVAGSIDRQRFQATLLTTFAATSLVLAAIGLYGLLAYGVVQRRQEIGIRIALGASRGAVRRLVLGDSLRLLLPGMGLGLVAAIALRSVFASLVFGIAPLDLGTLAAVCAALTAVALAASAIPALRATRIQPALTMREE